MPQNEPYDRECFQNRFEEGRQGLEEKEQIVELRVFLSELVDADRAEEFLDEFRNAATDIRD